MAHEVRASVDAKMVLISDSLNRRLISAPPCARPEQLPLVFQEQKFIAFVGPSDKLPRHTRVKPPDNSGPIGANLALNLQLNRLRVPVASSKGLLVRAWDW